PPAGGVPFRRPSPRSRTRTRVTCCVARTRCSRLSTYERHVTLQPANVAPNGASGGTAPAGSPAIVVYAQRERARALVRSAFPRRRNRVILTKTRDDFEAAFKTNLVDAAIVDVGGAQEETWRVAALARDYPSAPFFGLAALRAAEGPALAQCATYEFADVLIDAVDDAAARDIVWRQSFARAKRHEKLCLQTMSRAARYPAASPRARRAAPARRVAIHHRARGPAG